MATIERNISFATSTSDSMSLGGVNAHHHANIIQYLHFARNEREQCLRGVNQCVLDWKDKLLDKDEFTIEEFTEQLDGLLHMVCSQLESRLINNAHANVILLRQLCLQSEKWHLKLRPDMSQLENGKLLETINNFEELVFAGAENKKEVCTSVSEREAVTTPDGSATSNMKTEDGNEEVIYMVVDESLDSQRVVSQIPQQPVVLHEETTPVRSADNNQQQPVPAAMAGLTPEAAELPTTPADTPVTAALPDINRFPPVLDRTGAEAAVVDACSKFILAKEDHSEINEISISFLALSRNVAATSVKQPRTVFFTFHFYRFPKVTSERLLLGNMDGELPGDPASSPCVLRHIDKDGAVIAGPPGFQVKYFVDPVSLTVGEGRVFLQHLAQETLHVDLWDGHTQQLIGSCAIKLKSLCRQGHDAVQCSLELDVIARKNIKQETPSTVGDGPRGCSMKPASMQVWGRLLVRLANVGHPASQKGAKAGPLDMKAAKIAPMSKIGDIMPTLTMPGTTTWEQKEQQTTLVGPPQGHDTNTIVKADDDDCDNDDDDDDDDASDEVIYMAVDKNQDGQRVMSHIPQQPVLVQEGTTPVSSADSNQQQGMTSHYKQQSDPGIQTQAAITPTLKSAGKNNPERLVSAQPTPPSTSQPSFIVVSPSLIGGKQDSTAAKGPVFRVLSKSAALMSASGSGQRGGASPSVTKIPPERTEAPLDKTEGMTNEIPLPNITPDTKETTRLQHEPDQQQDRFQTLAEKLENRSSELSSSVKQISVSTKILYKCTLCGICVELGDLQNHQHFHMNTQLGIADKNAANLGEGSTELVSSVESIQNDELGEKPAKQFGIITQLSCDRCGKKFNKKGHLKNHIRQHDGKYYPCTVCDKQFAYPNSLRRHMRSDHPSHPARLDMSRGASLSTICQYCGKHFSTCHTLRFHEKIQHTEGMHECEQCGKKYRKASELLIHVRIHTGEKPFECTTCGAGFRSKGSLNTHLLIHLPEKRYKCKYCGKRMTQRSHLRIHERTHTGEKPYTCKLCDRRFNAPNDLTIHTRVHNKDKRYECDICSNRFITMHCMKKHRAKHTGEKPYECTTCGQRFTSNGSAMRHQNKVRCRKTKEETREDSTDIAAEQIIIEYPVY